MSKCTCGNPEAGFNCICEFVREHPGENEYVCEYCGVYQASRPNCVMCEEEEKEDDGGCLGCSYCQDGLTCEHPDRHVTHIVSDGDIPDDCPLLEGCI